jgi:hypothetical protein
LRLFVLRILVTLGEGNHYAPTDIPPIIMTADQPITPHAILGLRQQLAAAVETENDGDTILQRHAPDGYGSAELGFV